MSDGTEPLEGSQTQAVATADAIDDAPICFDCGYDLTGLSVDRCPECGREGALERAMRASVIHACRSQKRQWLWMMIAVYVAGTLVNALFPLGRAVDFLATIAIAIAAYFWCRADARLHRYSINRIILALVVLAMPIGMLLYFISKNRWMSLLKAVGVAVGTVLGAGLLGGLAYLAAYGNWPP